MRRLEYMKKQYSYESEWRQYAFPEDETHLATEDELKEKYTAVSLDGESAYSAGGMPVLSDGHTAVINTADENTIIYGATGSKKTRVLISTLISILAMCRNGESMIIPDIKGELCCKGSMAAKIRGILKKNGYKIRVLNFRDLNGDGFNILLTAYLTYRNGDRGNAMVMLHNLCDMLSRFYKGCTADPIWQKTAREYLMSVAVLLFETCDDPEKINLLTLASYADHKSCLNLEKIDSLLDRSNNIMTMLRNILAEPERTRMSTLATVNSFFSDLIINEKLLQMLSISTFRLEELYEAKTALFLIMPDEVDSYNSAVGLILSQISVFLVSEAYKFGGKLPRRVNYICDEFCNYYIPGMERNISAHRSRNIRWYLVCQSRKQLELSYPREYHTILANCSNIYFMGSSDPDLLRELSERAGYTNESEDGKPRPLITPANLRSIRKGWEKSEVYFSSGPLTCVTEMPDIDQYEFLKEFTEEPQLPEYEYKELQVYTSTEMLKDVYNAHQAWQNMKSGKYQMTEEELRLAEKYETMFCPKSVDSIVDKK